MNQEEDLEKLNFYLCAKFEFYESILTSNVIRIPSHQELNNLLFSLKKREIEYLYNHFHMSAITENTNKQREYAILIWKNWRLFFSKNMPEKNIMIEINDCNFEVIIYVYEIT